MATSAAPPAAVPANLEAEEDERPVFVTGEILRSGNGVGHWAYRIDDLIGEGRCCLVYSAHSLHDNDDSGHAPSRVAVKCYKRGRTYKGAVQRERYILELFQDPQHHVVRCLGHFEHKSVHCQVMELLDLNVRQVIFRNERRGLSTWAAQKFARDLLRSLCSLHTQRFVHADLKPANVMWSSQEGSFKLLDFGLTFHEDERDLHQIQTKGYQAPESAAWNAYKLRLKRSRKRKLQTLACCDIKDDAAAAPGADDNSGPSESSGVFTESELSPSLAETPTRQRPTEASPPASTSDLSSSSISGSPAAAYVTARRRPSLFSNAGGGGQSANYRHPCDARGGQSAKRKQPGDDQPPKIRPGAPSDMWAFSCLLFEMLTGSKLFQAGDRLAGVLKPLQLLEMKIGPTEVKYGEQNDPAAAEAFLDAKDLIRRCLADDPDERVTAEQALYHRFLQPKLRPTVRDMVVLPSTVLMLMDLIKDDDVDDNVKALLSNLRSKAERFGPVCSVRAHAGHAYVEFSKAGDCAAALTSKTLAKVKVKVEAEDRHVLSVFYPTQLWKQNQLYD